MAQQSIRSDFHTLFAEYLASDILYKRANYYYFLGKVDVWGSNDVPPINPIPTTLEYDNQIRGEMLYLKRINPSDVSLSIKRYQWEEDTVYLQWDHTKELKGEPFYCLNSEYSVYKCLHNAHGGPSTVEPTGQSFFPIKTSDGYIWKYMYNIPTFKRTKFASIEYMPVQKALSDSFYNQGSIDEVTILDGGEGYSDAQLTLITVNGTTTGSGATANLVVGPLGEIIGVTVTNGGSGYTRGVKLSLWTATGFGGKLVPVVVGGVVTSITIETPGFNYSPLDTIQLTVGGAILVPQVSRDSGSIVGVSIVDAGTGYVSAPSLTVEDVGGIEIGTGKYGNPSAIVTAIEYEGSIVGVTISDPGVNYRTDTSTQLIVQGDGSDAVFSPVVYQGKIVAVVVENRGINYTYATINVVGTGTGAQLLVSVSQSDFNSNQSIVEQTAVAGAVYSIVVTNQGENYSAQNTRVEVTGNGFGLTAVPVVVGGRVEKINVTNFGNNYNYCTVKIIDDSRPDYLGFVDAEAYAILSPQGGHGNNSPRELYSDVVAINSTLARDVDLNQIQQDFRNFGILRNPYSFSSNKFFTGETNFLVYKFRFDTVEDLLVDETLVNGINKYKVVAVDAITRTAMLQQIGESYDAPVGYFYTEANDGRQYQIISLDTIPSVNKFSGELLYTSYEIPFSFTEGQIVTIKTFIRL